MGKKNKIIFTNTMPDLVSDKYSPKPAIKFIPEWYKKMESYIPETVKPDSTPTIKKCIPVLDVMTAGYIIVSPFDIYVSVIDGEIVYKYPGPAQYKMIEGHPRKQGYLHPNAMEHPFPKWINPWGIKTPKGYSTLFIPPTGSKTVFIGNSPALRFTDFAICGHTITTGSIDVFFG